MLYGAVQGLLKWEAESVLMAVSGEHLLVLQRQREMVLML